MLLDGQALAFSSAIALSSKDACKAQAAGPDVKRQKRMSRDKGNAMEWSSVGIFLCKYMLLIECLQGARSRPRCDTTTANEQISTPSGAWTLSLNGLKQQLYRSWRHVLLPTLF